MKLGIFVALLLAGAAAMLEGDANRGTIVFVAPLYSRELRQEETPQK